MDHPTRTLLYELFLEPVAQGLERMLGFVRQSADRAKETGAQPLLTEPTGPVALPSRRHRPKP
jgi:hypothetical protein